MEIDLRTIKEVEIQQPVNYRFYSKVYFTNKDGKITCCRIQSWYKLFGGVNNIKDKFEQMKNK